MASRNCTCCGRYIWSSGGCITCNQQRTYCTCGALLVCGCGRKFKHDQCPNVILPKSTL